VGSYFSLMNFCFCFEKVAVLCAVVGSEKSVLFMIMGVDKTILYYTTWFYEGKFFSVLLYILSNFLGW
jgi:hypothetical protein